LKEEEYHPCPNCRKIILYKGRWETKKKNGSRSWCLYLEVEFPSEEGKLISLSIHCPICSEKISHLPLPTHEVLLSKPIGHLQPIRIPMEHQGCRGKFFYWRRLGVLEDSYRVRIKIPEPDRQINARPGTVGFKKPPFPPDAINV
jgi:DNA-directed RNA polymerase subunit RPC12/RpoP